MAKYRLTAPDGAVHEVTAPDDASQDDVIRYFQSQTKQATKPIDASPVGSTWQNTAAAFGKAAVDAYRGASQQIRRLGPQYNTSADFFGLPNQQDVDEARKRDEPLMATTAGKIGNFAGNVALAVPSAFVPGAATIPGAGAIGAGLGLLTPTTTGESPWANAAIGAAVGPAGVMAGRGVGALYQGGKALLEPFYEAGRQRIAGRTLQRFAQDPSTINRATNAPTITGARPTLAEQTGDQGLARLEDSLRTIDPQTGARIASRKAENNAARVEALRSLTGQDGARDAAVASRQAAVGPLYQEAFAKPADAAAVAELMKRPAIQEAAAAAKTNAKNLGQDIDPTTSVEGLHSIKLALDDAISKAKNGSAAQRNKAEALKTAQRDLVAAMEKMSPEYRDARLTFAAQSKPVNAFDTAAELNRRALSPTNDLAGTPTIYRNALMSDLQNDNLLVSRATGRQGLGGLADVMEPEPLNLLRTIGSEVDRAGAVQAAANGPGSATANRLASQNLLQQIVGPTGLPSSVADNALVQTLAKPLNLLYGGVAESRIQQALAEAVLDPAKAQAMLAAANPSQRAWLASFFQRASAARAVPTANALSANRPQQPVP